MRKLKAKDFALGIGAPYSGEESHEFLKEDECDNISILLEDAINIIKSKLS